MASALFSLADIAAQAAPRPIGQPAAVVRRGEMPLSLAALAPGRRELREHVGDLRDRELVQFATGGRWSAHELLGHVLAQTGPARVWIATWTITEGPLRYLRQLRDEGTITELALLLDHRIAARCPKAYQAVPALRATVKLSKCHAKVTVVENEQWGVTIISSQNYTRNPRIEAGMLTTCRASAAFHRAWLEKEIAGAAPFQLKS